MCNSIHYNRKLVELFKMHKISFSKEFGEYNQNTCTILDLGIPFPTDFADWLRKTWKIKEWDNTSRCLLNCAFVYLCTRLNITPMEKMTEYGYDDPKNVPDELKDLFISSDYIDQKVGLNLIAKFFPEFTKQFSIYIGDNAFDETWGMINVNILDTCEKNQNHKFTHWTGPTPIFIGNQINRKFQEHGVIKGCHFVILLIKDLQEEQQTLQEEQQVEDSLEDVIIEMESIQKEKSSLPSWLFVIPAMILIITCILVL